MKRKGFSVVEVLIALAIFSIAILGIGATVVYNIKFAKINKLRERALYKADKLLNYLTSLPYDSSCLTVGIRNCQTDAGTCCNGFAGDPEISYSVENLETDIKKISVTVKFKSGDYEGGVSLEQIKGNW
ncbi:prepilin-type N-terminal cleavage/methylation domain-containing protein [Desulfurobacterium thermolithotrophum]|uniref:type IV pilus modification PilV family protein n=1 Tax=Desulfurobacterium thermolithotrophum TaxID=64160 RepID=UPI0013D3B0E9|nr:prepilin-type N-terminal cleavage/methylation domain-containing protein [Desulfurobacterium thermolithotrophum]